MTIIAKTCMKLRHIGCYKCYIICLFLLCTIKTAYMCVLVSVRVTVAMAGCFGNARQGCIGTFVVYFKATEQEVEVEDGPADALTLPSHIKHTHTHTHTHCICGMSVLVRMCCF